MEATDAAHYEGIGAQSYGNTLKVVTYEANNYLPPMFIAQLVRSECRGH